MTEAAVFGTFLGILALVLSGAIWWGLEVQAAIYDFIFSKLPTRWIRLMGAAILRSIPIFIGIIIGIWLGKMVYHETLDTEHRTKITRMSEENARISAKQLASCIDEAVAQLRGADIPSDDKTMLEAAIRNASTCSEVDKLSARFKKKK